MREGRAFFNLALSLAQGDNLSMGATWSARCSSLILAAIICSSNRLLTHPSAQIRHSAGGIWDLDRAACCGVRKGMA
jgi:hypothetical protein